MVENLFLYECVNAQEAITMYNQGIRNKIVSSHKMNHASSRSHCIFSIQVDQLSDDGLHELKTLGQVSAPAMASSKMFLVDLAGSEKISIIGDLDKQSQRETIQINKSLMVLRKCIGALVTEKAGPHVPYRECKLTSVLKQSLGGNSYCLMIACISPSDANYEETVQTLNYALKTNNIKNQPALNRDPDQLLISDLKKQNMLLQSKLEQARTQRVTNYSQGVSQARTGHYEYEDSPPVKGSRARHAP